MKEYYTVKPSCLICDHASLADIDDHDMLIPCNVSRNGIMPCMEFHECCERFRINQDLEQLQEE